MARVSFAEGVFEVSEGALNLTNLVLWSSWGWSDLAQGILKRSPAHLCSGAGKIFCTAGIGEAYVRLRHGGPWAPGAPALGISIAGATCAVAHNILSPALHKIAIGSRLWSWSWGKLTSGCQRIHAAYQRQHLGSQRAAAEQARDQAHQAQVASGEATASSAPPSADAVRV